MANEVIINLSSITGATGFFTVEGKTATGTAHFHSSVSATAEKGTDYAIAATVANGRLTVDDAANASIVGTSAQITTIIGSKNADIYEGAGAAAGKTIMLGEGTDLINVNSNASIILGTGTDVDTVSVGGGTAKIRNFLNGDSLAVTGGTAIVNSHDTVTGGIVVGKAENNGTVSLTAAGAASINGYTFGAGTDAKVTVSGSKVNLVKSNATFSKDAVVTGSNDGAETINVTGGTVKFGVGSGKDVVSVTGGMLVADNDSITAGHATFDDDGSLVVASFESLTDNGNTIVDAATVDGAKIALDNHADNTVTVTTDVAITGGKNSFDTINVKSGKATIADVNEGDIVKVTGGTAVIGDDSIAGGTYTALENGGYSVTAGTSVNGALYSTATTFDSDGNTTSAANTTTPTGNTLSNGTTATTNDAGTITLGNTTDSLGATATINQDSVAVTGTDKADAITVTGDHVTVRGGAGADSVTVTKGTTNFADSDADDVVKVTKGATAVLSDGASIKSGMVTYDSTGTSYTAAAGTSINNSAVTGGTATVSGSNVTLGKGTKLVAGDKGLTVTANEAGSFIAITSDAVADTITLGSGVDTISLGAGVSYDQVTGLNGFNDSVDVLLTTSGVITNGSATDDSLSVTVDGVPQTATIADGNYYQYTDAAGKAYAWANPAESSTIDYSSLKMPAVINTTTNDSIGDVATGGAAADSIYAGDNDTIKASRGNDFIQLTNDDHQAENVTIGLGEKQDSVSVAGFHTGFDSVADTIDIDPDAAAGKISVDSQNRLTVLENGTRLTLTDVSVPDGPGVYVKFSNNGDSQNWQIVNGSATLDDEASIIYGVNGKTSEIVLNNNAESVTGYGIDLSNNKQLGDTRTYANIGAVDATNEKAEVTLFGAAATRNTLIGSKTAASSLWGGEGGNDVLSAQGGDTTFFYRGNYDGEDSIVSYNYESSLGGYGDIVEITDGKDFTLTRDGSSTVLNFGKGADSVSNKLTIVSGGNGVQYLRYKWNNEEQRAEVGQTDSKNTFVYDDNIDIYASGTKSDTISVRGGDTDATILLDGSTVGDSKKAAYGDKINTIDAHESTGIVFLAGAAGNDTIRGSQGDATLFGGAGDDVLYGNSKDVKETTFFFGTGCGNDTIASSNQTDKVMLYNANSTDVTGASVSGASLTLTLTDGSTLTVKNYATSCNTFVFADGASGTYDKSSKSMKYSTK